MAIPLTHDYMTVTLIPPGKSAGRLIKFKTDMIGIPEFLKNNPDIRAFDADGVNCSVELKKHGKSVYAIFCHPKMWGGSPWFGGMVGVKLMWPRVEQKGGENV